MTGDGNNLNDSVSIQFSYNTAAPKTLPWSEDFETFSLCSVASDCEATVCATTNDFVNATNGVEDDIDWRTNSGSTPSAGTGPSMDFNPGTPSGKYMYLEASGSPVCASKTAHLVTPCIDLTTANNPQLTFAYNLNGATMGILVIDVYANGTWTNSITSPLGGNQGAAWQTTTVSLNAFVGDIVNIRFRGITGNNWESDMAIDDIAVTQTVGVEETVFGDIKVYPNPVKNNLIVDGMQHHQDIELAITDIAGKRITNFSSTNNANQKLIDVSGLSSGIYFLKISKSDMVRTIKFVKQ